MSSLQYNIEAELSSAKNRLANLQKQQQQQNTVESSSSNNTESLITPAQQLYQRALKAKDNIEYITLNQSLIEFMSSNVANSSNQSDGTDAEELIKATEMCTSLGLLLIQYSSNHHHNNNEGLKSTKLYNETLKWYTNLYNTTRTKAQSTFSTQLYKLSSEFPSTDQSSTVIKEALASSDSSLNSSGKCLVELQIVHDVIMQLQSNTQGQQRVELPPTWRLDIVDELCKPIANRIKFLFLNEETGIMSSSSGQQPQTGNAQQQQQPQSKIERLPEWTFRYLREVIDNHGVLSLVMEDGVQPLIDTVVNTLIQRILLLSTTADTVDMDNDNQHTPAAHEIIQQLKDQYYSHSTIYFLREISRMARHVIRSKSFFQHPDVVGSECLDRSIVLKGIEQLFLFDTFMEDKMKDIGVGYSGVNVSLLPIRMLDTFLSTNESLLRWWLDEERDGIIATLHECGSSSLASYQNDEDIFTSSMDIVDKEEEGDSSSSVDRLYPPISELFIALLHSARSKSNMFMSNHSRQMYIGNVIAQACSVYLDLVHAEATHLRKQLLARPSSTSSSTSTGVPSVNVLRSTTNLPSDKLLTCNTMEWSALITGTHLASQLLLQPSLSSTDTLDDNDILEKVGVSMQHLCSAMVDDYTSALVETIIMERAKLATYMMRAPFLLSDPLPDLPELPLSPERRGQRDKDTSNGSKILALSPDLNDSMHVVSVSIKACNEVKAKVGSMFQVDDSSDSGEVEPSMMLYHGCQSIHDAVKCAIGQKLLDIALDPQGMCPEIYQSGALQFLHDVKAVNRLFSARQTDQQAGPMERVVTSARLMSLESSQIHAIKETFRSLVDADSPIRNLFGRTVDDSGEMNEPSISRLNVDDFYKDQRLIDEAGNMLEAKGFNDLALEEALSVLNRRL